MARSSDLTRPRQEVYATLDAESHRRFIKTHTPLDGIPLDPAVTYMGSRNHPARKQRLASRPGNGRWSVGGRHASEAAVITLTAR